MTAFEGRIRLGKALEAHARRKAAREAEVEEQKLVPAMAGA
jgi:hypothetical protein